MPHAPKPLPPRRRALIRLTRCAALLAPWPWLTGCALPGTAPARRPLAAALAGTDTLLDLRAPGHSRLGLAELLAELRRTDQLLLGELHDHPAHHARRGALLALLARRSPGASPAVLAEQLTTGLTVRPGPAGPAGAALGAVAAQGMAGEQGSGQAGEDASPPADLLARLQAAGFDPRAWGWPLYQALFGPIDAAGLPLAGANLPNDVVRRIAREGEAALPADLATLLRTAPLGSVAQAALDEDLLQGHCGHLPAARLPQMRLAQRARDAALWQALQLATLAHAAPGSQAHPSEAPAAARPPGPRAVLLAGNGHVRRDYGVPRLAAVHAPAGQRLLSIGFGEHGTATADAPYDLLWLCPPQPREDPCLAFKRG